MPAPGEQHLNHGSGLATANPLEETKPHISEYTAQEIATLQSRLEKQLGPEYISSRPGPGGQKVHYITGEKCIQLANEVFGFNGWSSSIMQIQVDYVDEDPMTRKVSLGLSVIVRVTLRDGTYHEDIGYGEMENCKGKGAAFHKAKKEATTDALKRALRNFGNVLGNCIYDKAYLTKVMKVKVRSPKWDVDALHRHSDHAQVKKEAELPRMEEIKHKHGSDLKKPASDDSTETLNGALGGGGFLDEDFDDFDEADFRDGNDPDSRPDEVVLPVSIPSHHLDAGASAAVGQPGFKDQNHRHQTISSHAQSLLAPAKPLNGNQATEASVGRSSPLPQQQQTHQNHIYNGPERLGNGISGGVQTRSPQDTVTMPRSMPTMPLGIGRVLNQPSRTDPPSVPRSPAYQQKSMSNSGEESMESHSAGPVVESGFFSARAASMLLEVKEADGPSPMLSGNLPAFNPHAESPSIRKTPGINHNQSMPLTKELRHVPGSTQTGIASAAISIKSNIVNPQLDVARRIGAPGSSSPMANRNLYKPPTMKRPFQGQAPARPPLGDLPTNETLQVTDNGGDIKRARLNGI